LARKIEIQITGDASQLEKAFGKAQSAGSKWQQSLEKANKGATVALAGLAVGAAFSVKAASDLSESVNAVQVVFGRASQKVLEFGKNAATSVGLSARAFNELVTPIGASLRNVGLSADEAGRESIKLAKRAADMASVFKVDVSEALEAIQAGLRGEADPLERFGVGLSDAAVQAKALELGMKKTDGQLSASQKTQARLAILYEQTNRVAGDFENTSDELANQQRILRAQLENTAASLGSALLPAATQAASALAGLVRVSQEHESAVKGMAIAVGGAAVGIKTANASLSIYNSRLLGAFSATKNMRLALSAGPWVAAAVAAGGLVYWLSQQRAQSDAGADAVDRLVEALRRYNGALDEGRKAREAVRDSNLRLEAAELAVERAQKNREQVEQQSGKKSLAYREAQHALKAALEERRKAEHSVKDATKANAAAQDTTRRRLEQTRNRAEDLADLYNDKLERATRISAHATRGLSVQAQRSNLQLAKGDVVADYAAKLRSLAKKAQESNPKLAAVATTAAALASAWKRVVDLPSAKSFTVRFNAYTNVETNRGQGVTGGARSRGIVTPRVALGAATAGPVVNINVEGSVVREHDLARTVHRNLLRLGLAD
jgi:hypothetical protein